MSVERADAVARLTEEPATTGLFTDFDGSIATIVADPRDALPLETALVALHRLARVLGVVAVISGRPGYFLAERLQLAASHSGLLAYGLYGRESVRGDGTVAAPPVSDAGRAALIRVIEKARRAAPDALVEDKGAVASLHWRTRPTDEPVLRAVAALAAANDGLEIRDGRQLIEVALPAEPDKGNVIKSLVYGLSVVCAIGDDVGDLAAFRALDELAADRTETLRVAVRSDEGPPELFERADLLLADPPDLAAFLSEIADALAVGGGENA